MQSLTKLEQTLKISNERKRNDPVYTITLVLS